MDTIVHVLQIVAIPLGLLAAVLLFFPKRNKRPRVQYDQ